MLPGRRRWRLVRRVSNAVLAALVSAAVLAVCAAGFAMVPALGPALDPGHGAWASAAGGVLPSSQVLTLPGLRRSASVTFDRQGMATIRAASMSGAALALGYLHARFRLAQLDLARRLAEGRLAALVGPRAVGSDAFELRLGLLRIAGREWATMRKGSPAAAALLAYSCGVNDYLAQVRANGQWPAIFSLAGVYPAPWTPVDSLAVQGELTQQLDYTSAPLDYALLERSLGARRTRAWFPVATVPPRSAVSATASARSAVSAAAQDRSVARAAAAILADGTALRTGQARQDLGSNAWVMNGPKVAGGRSMLAAEQGLPQTLPSAWFEVAMSAPGFDVSGVTVPGLPSVVIGRNQHIAWSMTGSQSQSALFYVEQTSSSRPGQYFWRGRWRRMREVKYRIAVRGGRARTLTVDRTVHGPVLTSARRAVSVDWMGATGSPDVAVLLAIGRASNFAQFRSALAGWRAPAQSFVYADDRGNIGALSAGLFPVVRHGSPWLPLPGTGADDVTGVIPFAVLPHSYDPPGHVIVAAGQRPVTASYPYYQGTAANDVGTSYRGSHDFAFLDRRSAMTASSSVVLQASLTDELARHVLPTLLAALRHARLTSRQGEAEMMLRGWNYSMAPDSAAAAVWWTFWSAYLSATFGPWWKSAAVPVRLDRTGLGISASQVSLDQALEHWTLTDSSNPAFTPPRWRARTATSVMRVAFRRAVASLHARLGGGPPGWTWGKLHLTRFRSLTGVAALGYGPRQSGGDSLTAGPSYGMPTSSDGPSWRMIISWPGREPARHGSRGSGNVGPSVLAEASYPGGLSENPASPWYENLIGGWWNGAYLPMPPANASATAVPGSPGPVRWELRP